MKRILPLVIAIVFAGTLSAQTIISTSFENWTGINPDGWKGTKTNLQADSIIRVTTGTQYGSNAVQLNNPTTSHRRFSSQPVPVTAGQNFTVKYWAKGQGDIRVGLFDSSNVVTTSGYHYSAYISVNTNTWTEYSQNITADTTWNTAQFIFSIRNTNATGGHLKIDSAVVFIPAPTGPTSIYDIQYTTDAAGESPLIGQQVQTGGIVSAVYASGYFIQDGVGPWRGLHVFDSNNFPAIGDSVRITGYVSEYFSMTQISSVSSFLVFSSSNPVYAPSVISTAAVNTEAYEGVLVRVNNATCVNANAGFGMWTVNDGSQECKIHNLIYAYTPTQNTIYQITGPVYYAFAEFRIEPRDVADVVYQGTVGVEDGEMESEIQFYPNPVDNILNIKSSKSISVVTILDLTGRIVLTTALDTNSSHINRELLIPGFYSLLVDQQGDSKSFVFIKK
ncbi:MAG TPA: T9SS type A sorting domain-containing protein [Flavobacteriales bacterium]|nr:T9SS type A sorting domain-containing protein [Flavobacteriales bacterium]